MRFDKSQSRSRTFLCLVVVLCQTALGRADAQPAAPGGDRQNDRDAIAFVVGNIQFLLVHEIAHFLIAEKGVPIIGPEENAPTTSRHLR